MPARQVRGARDGVGADQVGPVGPRFRTKCLSARRRDFDREASQLEAHLYISADHHVHSRLGECEGVSARASCPPTVLRDFTDPASGAADMSDRSVRAQGGASWHTLPDEKLTTSKDGPRAQDPGYAASLRKRAQGYDNDPAVGVDDARPTEIASGRAQGFFCWLE